MPALTSFTDHYSVTASGEKQNVLYNQSPGCQKDGSLELGPSHSLPCTTYLINYLGCADPCREGIGINLATLSPKGIAVDFNV